jgi:hypothetical protein
MKLYSGTEVKYIVEDFLAEHLNLDSINLKASSVMKLKEICDAYGIEVDEVDENIK